MEAPNPDSEPTRRGFFARASIAIGALLGAVLTVPTLGAFLNPLWRRGSREQAPFLAAGSAGGFPMGTPQKVTLTGTAQDAWASNPNQTIGAVWVIRRSEALEADSFDVFSTICPHLGCAIQHQNAGNAFHCPCHGSQFETNGERTETGDAPNPSPRGMDRLTTRVEDGTLLVQFQRFTSGTAERIEIH
jgi:Rieske Fe-S protein